jgi:hypothetical protein
VLQHYDGLGNKMLTVEFTVICFDKHHKSMGLAIEVEQ